MPEPMDYARAESDDVIRKKFRRRVIWFVVTAVVVVVITSGWIDSANGRYWSTGSYYSKYPTVTSGLGWIGLSGPVSQLAGDVMHTSRSYGNEKVGVLLAINTGFNSPKWQFLVRYWMLFLLAAVPWLVTLIRVIRIWRVKHAARIGQ